MYQDLHTTLYNQNFMDNDLPDESVQMVVTSPPYWGLRKYSGDQDLIWAGDKECQHEWGDMLQTNKGGIGQQKGLKGNTHITETWDESQTLQQGNFCQLCGAWRGAFGLEPTPEMYAEHTVQILREIRRVLRKDGVVFWNIGDSYSGSGKGIGSDHGKAVFTDNEIPKANHGYKDGRSNRDKRFGVGSVDGLKPKDLCLIPFRVAIAAQEDGWWIRSDIIWSKPNPMPESVTDRPTNSHEYILMLTKSAKYYWDADAVREDGEGRLDRGHAVRGRIGKQGYKGEPLTEPNGRNLRSVWTFPTQPYPEAHFAVFPEKLPELCIKATTPEVGCCSKCGMPWVRVIEKEPNPSKGFNTGTDLTGGAPDMGGNRQTSAGLHRHGSNCNVSPGITTGWQPQCKCNADKVPSIVLDPFAGAGTTLWVAKKLNRKSIGFELSTEYCDLIIKRVHQQVML